MNTIKQPLPEHLSPEYAHSNTRLQHEYRQWLHQVEFEAPYALTLTASRPTLAQQNKLANRQRISNI